MNFAITDSHTHVSSISKTIFKIEALAMEACRITLGECDIFEGTIEIG